MLAMFAAPDLFRVGVSLDFGDGQGGGPNLLSLAGNLKGKLLLVYGPHREDAEIMARALIDAKRFFDVLPIPGANHSFSKDDDYVMDAVRRYFEEHLE